MVKAVTVNSGVKPNVKAQRSQIKATPRANVDEHTTRDRMTTVIPVPDGKELSTCCDESPAKSSLRLRRRT